MALNIVAHPYQYFGDPDAGRPIAGGEVYVGIVDLDPTILANQKSVTLRQEDGTEVSVSQPIDLSAGGYPTFNGSPVAILVDGDYSLAVLDSLGVQKFYSSTSPVAFLLTRDNTVAVVDTVSDLTASSFESGITVDTRGYTTAGDGGGARYLIQTAAEFGGTPDGYGNHTLANSNVAVLQTNGPVSILQYGAKGNGLTVDDPSVVAANAAHDTIVFTAPKTYLTNGLSPAIDGRTWIIEKGATLLHNPPGAVTHSINILASNFTVTGGGTIDGAKAVGGGNEGIFVNAGLDDVVIDGLEIQNTGADGIRVKGATGPDVTNLVIRNNYIHDTTAKGINVQWEAPGCIVSNNRIVNAGTRGIQVSQSKNVVVEGNKTTGNGVDLACEIFICPNSTISNNVIVGTGVQPIGVSLAACDNSVFSNNVVENVGSVGIEIVDTDHFVCEGNAVDTVVELTALSAFGISVTRSNYVSISGGTIKDTYQGIKFEPSNPAVISVSGVVIENTTNSGIFAVAGITQSSISGNVLKSIGGDGIRLTAATKTAIVGNRIESGGNGIALPSASSDCNIVANNLTGPGAVANADGIELASGTRTTIIGNTITNYASGRGVFLLAGTDTTVIGNTLTGNSIALTDSATSTVAHSNNGALGSPAYTVTNGSVDRTYDASATTVGELANVLATVIADLQANKIIG